MKLKEKCQVYKHNITESIDFCAAPTPASALNLFPDVPVPVPGTGSVCGKIFLDTNFERTFV
jgi:hypothetical protein